MTKFRSELDRIKAMSGSLNEQTIRPAFRSLLRDWARSNELFLLEEHPFKTKLDTTKYPDGTIVHDLRVPLGYWEAKDTQDDLDEEIEKKTSIGYPTSNIIYETSELAVLIQNGSEIHRTDMSDVAGLTKLLTRFFAYERPEIRDFRRAIGQFQVDLPEVLKRLREKITEAYKTNTGFAKAARAFLSHAKETINPTIGEADVREMLIQHILTEDIFNHVFNESDFHKDNNVARQLYDLERLFFRGAVKKNTLKALEPYYAAIRAAAAEITAHSEKQTFLKVIYESFYKTYNPNAADRLGVVYTPSEIVRFMLDGTDWLCRKHFGKGLIEPNVEILDPCTGTGTYICELLEMFRGDRERLAYKYKNELHANELAILPYYVANLNIEATYAQIVGQYAEYPALCFVDTLDNTAALGIRKNHQYDWLAGISDENIARVKKQNSKKMTVVIGNPPYNDQQNSVSDGNKNRAYTDIDRRVKNSITKFSSATKTRNQDPFIRFFAWATERIAEDGIVSFITNRSYIEGGSHDGLRRYFKKNFCDIYVVDLGGAWRLSGHRGGENVFEGIGTGVAIIFLVRKENEKFESIKYSTLGKLTKREDKLAKLSTTRLSNFETKLIFPDENDSWLATPPNSWDGFVSLIDDKTNKASSKRGERSVFKHFRLGISTNRDKWIYSIATGEVEFSKRFLQQSYEAGPEGNLNQKKISWSDTLKSKYKKHKKLGNLDEISVLVRPYTRKTMVYSPKLIDRPGILFQFQQGMNKIISINDLNSRARFCVTSSDRPSDLHVGDTKDGYQCLPQYRYTESGERIDNITDWALRKFRAAYDKKLTKDDVFNYCYAVLHDPVYRETYAINLKREFPRIPFYPDFKKWRDWGKTLMALHIGYEDVTPLQLGREDKASKRAKGSTPRVILKSRPEDAQVVLDEDTTLTGVPIEAWDYRLGNRSAIDWVLDQHKEKKPRDPTIREKYNTYRFADYKDHVIDLLGRVAKVSVATVKITNAMAVLDRSDWA